MPVPSVMSDLSTIASSNSPAGTEAIGTNLDNYLRGHASLIRQGYALASVAITAASTIDVASADGMSVRINGSATIASLGTGFQGCVRELRFAGVCTLTHSGNVVLPNGVNWVTAVNDVLTFRCTNPGQWHMVNASRGGTVTSVAISGGTTGITVSGSPITGSGTITLAGTLAVANGGTGSTSAATARTALGAHATITGAGLTKVTVSSAAPGALANGELYLRYS